MKKALITNGVVHEVVSTDTFDTFNDAVKAQCVDCPDATVEGMLYDGAHFTAPPPVTPPAPKRPLLSPMAFYLAFTPRERILIKGSQDPFVQEFWQAYELAVQTGTMIDPNLASVTGGIDYLRLHNIIDASRVEDILNGVAQ